MKRLILLTLLGLLACNLIHTQQPAFTPAPAATQIPTAAATPEAALGTSKNPLILVLPPSTQPASDVTTASNTLVGLLEKSTGFKIVSVMPPSEIALVKAFGSKNAHIGVLTPFAYLLASEEGTVEAAFVRQQGNETFYGAQFIARNDAGFTRYFDPIKAANMVEGPIALAQFRDKKPCWTDQFSASGYVIPLGFLAEAGVRTREPAFLAGHPTVVRAVYSGGICDFGATYVDARTYPGLQDQYPDLPKKVDVIWQIPAIIPYDSLVFARGLSEDMHRALTRAFVDLMTTTDGKSTMQTLYGFNAMQVVQDGQYDAFRKVVKASGLDLGSLIK
jgi:phosphate/phosphite/phosphonate ABC transporter binding protein